MLKTSLIKTSQLALREGWCLYLFTQLHGSPNGSVRRQGTESSIHHSILTDFESFRMNRGSGEWIVITSPVLRAGCIQSIMVVHLTNGSQDTAWSPTGACNQKAPDVFCSLFQSYSSWTFSYTSACKAERPFHNFPLSFLWGPESHKVTDGCIMIGRVSTLSFNQYTVNILMNT